MEPPSALRTLRADFSLAGVIFALYSIPAVANSISAGRHAAVLAVSHAILAVMCLGIAPFVTRQSREIWFAAMAIVFLAGCVIIDWIWQRVAVGPLDARWYFPAVLASWSAHIVSILLQ